MFDALVAWLEAPTPRWAFVVLSVWAFVSLRRVRGDFLAGLNVIKALRDYVEDFKNGVLSREVTALRSDLDRQQEILRLRDRVDLIEEQRRDGPSN